MPLLMSDTGLTIVGAGVVGLAIAARLAPRVPGLVILERHARHGQESSSRNSEVVHAGIYYPAGSWKARLCTEGNRAVREIATRHDIPQLRCGKLITATTPEELPALERVFELARANDVPLQRLTVSQVRALEPQVATCGGLLSPNTGVVSAHGLMEVFLRLARDAGAILKTRCELLGLERRTEDWRLEVSTPAGLESFTSERVVNAAGLDADALAALAGIDIDAAGYRQHWCKGSYFTTARRDLVSRLVYPAPEAVSLGVHAILDYAGRLRFGPDVEYLRERRADYDVPAGARPRFGAAIRRLLPGVSDADLAPDTSGIRAKLQGPHDGFRDFVIAEESDRGRSGLVNLVGIDSPGLTASPAIAARVECLLA
jgi:L-2-hydroxyglutarate oxidase LhgO